MRQAFIVAVAAAPANFVLVSGVTAVDANCLAASGAGVWLESCEAAVARAQGKEIGWDARR